MARFGGLSKAKAEGRNPKLDENGDYACVVTKVCERTSIQGGGGKSYVIETTVLESTNPDIAVGEDRTITINRLDSAVAWEKASAFGNLKGFVAACLSDINGEVIDPDLEVLDGDPEGWEKAADASIDEGLLEGSKFRVKVYRKDTKKSKAAAAAGSPEGAVEILRFPEPKFRAYSEG